MNNNLKIIIHKPLVQKKYNDTRDWYKINEIKKSDFLECIKELFDVVEKKIECKGEDDKFLKTFITEQEKLSDEEWYNLEKSIRFRKILTMKIGTFHEKMFSKFISYEKVHKGIITFGCDLRKKDDTEYWEIKNRENTMNSNSAAKVAQNFEQALKHSKKCYLVYVNSTKLNLPRFNISSQVNILNGRNAYNLMAGRDNFYDDLVDTFTYASKNFKTFNDLKSNLEKI